MRRPPRPATLTALALAAVLAATAACTGASPFRARSTGTRDLQVTLPADVAGIRVRVEMFNGDIQVRAGATGEVTATVTTVGVGATQADAEADRAKIGVTLDAAPDGSVLLQAVYQPDPGSPDDREASAVVTVPPGVALDLRTSNGAVIVADVDGPVDARTSNGPITIADAPVGATVRTSNGAIDISGGGLLDLESSNARITIFGTEATVLARTTNGEMRFEGTFSSSPQGLETSNGPITLVLAADAAFALDASTSNATVTLEGFEIRTTGAADGDELQGTVGAGGPAVTLRTSSGAIVVRAQ